MAAVFIPAIPLNSYDVIELRGGPSYLADLVFDFLEDGGELLENTCSSGNGYVEDDEEEENPRDVEADRSFWEEQDQLIQVFFFLSFL